MKKEAASGSGLKAIFRATDDAEEQALLTDILERAISASEGLYDLNDKATTVKETVEEAAHLPALALSPVKAPKPKGKTMSDLSDKLKTAEDALTAAADEIDELKGQLKEALEKIAAHEMEKKAQDVTNRWLEHSLITPDDVETKVAELIEGGDDDIALADRIVNQVSGAGSAEGFLKIASHRGSDGSVDGLEGSDRKKALKERFYTNMLGT